MIGVSDRIKKYLRIIERKIAAFVQSYFSLVVFGWIILLAGLVYTSRNQIAAAVIGTGPFALYYLYEEIVKNPRLEVIDEEIKYRKLFGTSSSDIMEGICPIIEVYLEIENRGRKTAEDLQVDYKINGRRLKARWNDGHPVENIDLNPNGSEEAVLARFVPDTEVLLSIAGEIERAIYVEQMHQVSNTSLEGSIEDESDEVLVESYEDMMDKTEIVLTDKFRSLDEDKHSISPIDFRQMSIHFQVPYSKSHEETMMRQKDDDPKRSYWFIGRHIEPEMQTEVDVVLNARNWSSENETLQIDLKSAVEDGEWVPRQSRFKDIKKKLDDLGWKNR